MARGVCSPGAACSVLSAVASLVSGRRVQSAGSRAWLPRSMWDPPGSGIESVSPALTGGFLTNGPSEKSSLLFKTCAFLGLFLQPRSLLFLPTAFLNFKKKIPSMWTFFRPLAQSPYLHSCFFALSNPPVLSLNSHV